MKLHVQFFAAAREIVGKSSWPVELREGATVADLRIQLIHDFPKLNSMAVVLLVAVNNRYAEDVDVLVAGDSIACFPPVSGG